MAHRKRGSDDQLELPLGAAAPREQAPEPDVLQAAASQPAAPEPKRDVSQHIRQGLRVIQGGGQKKQEALTSRDAVVRVLIETGADLLLRRISSVRAEEIERRVDRVLNLFDRVDATPILMPVLQRELDELEALMGETRERRRTHRAR